jgi:hypothetical protein
MNFLKIDYWAEKPINYTGILEYNSHLYWLVNDKRHRLDGPAIESLNGSKYWFLNNKRHRVDGPAIEYSDGDKYWYLNGVEYSQEEWFERLSEEDKLNAIWNLR